MKSFTDDHGRIWTLEVYNGSIKRCRANDNCDLPGLIEDNFAGFNALCKDYVAMVAVLHTLCEDQIKKQGMSDEDFGRCVRGDVYERAWRALLDEIIDFFPNAEKREILRKIVTKTTMVERLAIKEADSQLEAIDPATLVRNLIARSGNLPASSESIQDRSPSENLT